MKNGKTLLKLMALAALVGAAAAPARAGKFVDTYVGTSSGAYFVGGDGGSVSPAKDKSDRVFTSSGAVVIQSTSATAGHKVVRVNNNAGTEILSLTQGGVLTANVTGNAATATALAANGANCEAGNYPLGVDPSGAVEGCTAAGIGDAVLNSTQTWSGGNTLYGNTTFYGLVYGVIGVSSTTRVPSGYTTTNSVPGLCITNSSVTFTVNSTGNAFCSWNGNAANNGAANGTQTALWCANRWAATGQTGTSSYALYNTAVAGYMMNSSFTRYVKGIGVGSKTCCIAVSGDSGTTTSPDNMDASLTCGEAY
jgi:hypothetical protein